MTRARSHGRGHHSGRGRRRSSRTRHLNDDGQWVVSARVERFVEPALLLVLRERPGHGYEIAEEVEGFLGGERVDLGNLYRMLRSMEEESLVSSVWTNAKEGKGKRTYELTDSGRDLLDAWIEALGGVVHTIEQLVAGSEQKTEGNTES